MRQRLKNLARTVQSPDISRHELDENTGFLVDAVLMSLLFCVSLLALVTCLSRLPTLPKPHFVPATTPAAATAQPGATAQPAGPLGWPDPRTLTLGFTG